MTDKSQQQEPSMEEILASIRRIISEDAPAEDEQPTAEEAPAAPPTSFDEPPPMDDFEPEPVLEALLPPVEEPEPAPVLEAPPPPPAPRDDVMELTNVVVDTPRPSSEPFIDLNRPVMPHQRLVSDTQSMSSSEYFARLAIIAQERGQLGGSITVEEMARELMRPMLQSWLDENLPNIVERLVQREIERIVRKAHDL